MGPRAAIVVDQPSRGTQPQGPLPTHYSQSERPLSAGARHATGEDNQANPSSALNSPAVTPASLNAISVTDPSRLA